MVSLRTLKNIFSFRGYGSPESISTKIITAEIVVIISGLYLLGFYLNKEDPLFINSELNFLYNLLPIALITLFYGMFAGLIYFAIFTVLAYLLYPSISYSYFTSLLLLLLVFSEFWFYWSGKLKEAEIEYNYINQRLKDLTAEFTLLKLSYDQLERAYISKPISLRDLILDLRKSIFAGADIYTVLKKVFELILVNYDVEEAALIVKPVGRPHRLIASTEGIKNINIEDPLIKTAIESQRITYISDLKESEVTEYLAAIPVSIEDELFYVFVIKRMPFMKLNTETLLIINLLIYYLAIEKAKGVYKAKNHDRISKFFDLMFLKEIYKMMEIYKKFGLVSHLVIFCLNVYDSIKFNVLRNIISENIRGADLFSIVNIDDDVKAIAVLLPFTDDFGAELFINRIKKVITEELSQEFFEDEVLMKIYKITEKHIEKLMVCHET